MYAIPLVILFFFLLVSSGAQEVLDEEDEIYTEFLLAYDFSKCQAGQGRRLQRIDEVQIRNSIVSSNINSFINAATNQSVASVDESNGLTLVTTDGTPVNVSFVYLPHLQMEIVEVSDALGEDGREAFTNFAKTLDCVEDASASPAAQPAGDTRKPEFFRFTGHRGGIQNNECEYPNDHLADGHQWWYSSVLNMMKYSPTEAKSIINPRFQDLHQIWHGGQTDYPIILTESGVDKRHPDLQSKRWFNKDENGGDRYTETGQCRNRVDDDDNGYTDDCYGPRRRRRPRRPRSHATQIAGLICAKTNNDLLMASSCPGCTYVAPRSRSIFGAFDYAIAIKSKVVNFSRVYGYFMPPKFWWFLRRALRYYSREVDGMLVVAAGNVAVDLEACDGPLQFPFMFYCDRSGGRLCELAQSDSNVICVAASDKYGKAWEYTTYGSQVTAFAPGVQLETITRYDSTKTVYGTSYAAALMSGVLGLIYSKFPNLTSEQIRKIIRVSCRPGKGPQLEKSECGGIIDAVYAFGHAAMCHADPDSCGIESCKASLESNANIKDWFCSAARRYGGVLADLCP